MGTKIIVTSDSHRNIMGIREVLSRHPDAKYLFHLGDLAADAKLAVSDNKNVTLLCVKGNCDSYDEDSPYDIIKEIDGFRFLLSHGHNYYVKHMMRVYEEHARENRVHAALFGHTHTPKNEYKDGLYLFNPGALSGYHPTYGIIETHETGIYLSVAQF